MWGLNIICNLILYHMLISYFFKQHNSLYSQDWMRSFKPHSNFFFNHWHNKLSRKVRNEPWHNNINYRINSGFTSVSVTSLFSPRNQTQDPTLHLILCLLQFSSVAQLCLTLCNPMNLSSPGLPVHHQLRSLLTHVHQVGHAIQPSHPL